MNRALAGTVAAVAAAAGIYLALEDRGPTVVRWHAGETAPPSESRIEFHGRPQHFEWWQHVRTAAPPVAPSLTGTGLELPWTGCTEIRARFLWQPSGGADGSWAYSQWSNVVVRGECIAPAPDRVLVPAPPEWILLAAGIMVLAMLKR